MRKMMLRLTAIWLLLLITVSCSSDSKEPDPIVAPSNLEVSVDIVGASTQDPLGDGSGTVNFQATADNAVGYQFSYRDEEKYSADGKASFTFNETGKYNVNVVANGMDDTSIDKNVEVEVRVEEPVPGALLEFLTGNDSRSWRIKAESPGHFGLGEPGGSRNQYYGAAAYEKTNAGMYDDRYIFNQDGTFTHITNGTNDNDGNNPAGTVFGRVGLINELGGAGGGTQSGDDILNYPLNDYEAVWNYTEIDGQEAIALSSTAFLGYYTGGDHTYQIISRNSNEMIVKTTDGNGEFDWWFTLIAADADTGGNASFDTLIWSEEFDTDGAPDPENWNYELGDGCPNLCGWGNGEQQWYTDDADNIAVENGVLRITAIAEPIQGYNYSSARVTTKDKFEFTYGKVEVRAKLPEGGGTWPAIWMLGGDIDTNPWPGSGEIDIMEHVGNNPNVVSSATHDPLNFGGNARFAHTTVENATTEFHTYTLEWTSEYMTFLVDGNAYHTVSNYASLPYNKDFYLLLNIAMGGNLGGSIDPAFTSGTMEIDYIRVYQ